jgi:hypothetical protein
LADRSHLTARSQPLLKPAVNTIGPAVATLPGNTGDLPESTRDVHPDLHPLADRDERDDLVDFKTVDRDASRGERLAVLETSVGERAIQFDTVGARAIFMARQTPRTDALGACRSCSWDSAVATA